MAKKTVVHAGPAELAAAEAAAVSTAVVVTKGTPTAPTTDQLQALLSQHATLINQQSTVIQQQQATIAAFPQVLADAISLNNTQVVMPGLQAILGGTLPGSLDTLKELVAQMQADESGAAQMLASLNTLTGRMATAEGLISSTAQTLTTATSALATVQGQVGTLTSTTIPALTTTVQGIPTTIAQAKQDVKTELLGGAGAAYDTLQELAQMELNAESVAQALALRLGSVEGVVNNATTGVAALNAALNSKALASDLVAATSTLTTLQSAVNNGSTGLVATNTLAAAQKTRVDGLITTTVPALQADTAQRLLRAGDTSTGPQMQPTAVLGGAAPRLDQTYGGLNAPIRFVTGVGATSTPMLPGPLTDPTPQGRKAKPYLVILTMRTAPTVGATVTVGTTPGGSEVFSKSFLLTGLPLVNNILAPTPPVFIELPAGTTLHAKATAGTWDVEVLSYYKS